MKIFKWFPSLINERRSVFNLSHLQCRVLSWVQKISEIIFIVFTCYFLNVLKEMTLHWPMYTTVRKKCCFERHKENKSCSLSWKNSDPHPLPSFQGRLFITLNSTVALHWWEQLLSTCRSPLSHQQEAKLLFSSLLLGRNKIEKT